MIEEQKIINLANAIPVSATPLRVTAWVLRALVLVFIALLCVIADSYIPAFAFALTFGPTVLFVAAFVSGAFEFPRILNSVHPVEPVLYRWLGVGLVKWIVATPIWPVLVGVVPPPRPTGRTEFFNYIERSTQGAEICHWLTFVLALSIALLCVAVDRISVAIWILVFNLILNAYPIVLQRSNRWRLHTIRLKAVPSRVA